MSNGNPGKKMQGLVKRAQQSARSITDKAKNEIQKGKDPQEKKKPLTAGEKRQRRRKIWRAVGTVCLVGVLSLVIFAGIFMIYVNTALKGHVELDLSEYTQEVSTELYYQDAASGEWVMYQTLFANENRIWVESDQIPDYLKKATIAIEDKRFETHHGVDWVGTIRAIVSTMTGGDVQGGSTITQQMIKNITGNNEVTVKRKITEIYQALALEKEYDKDEILTIYLNVVFFGNQCYGIKTASQMYFNKDVTELSLAECASLISITNNPSLFDPLNEEWGIENNRERQLLVLENMLEQGMIDQAAYDAAVAEDVVFSNGNTILGNKAEPPEAQEQEEKPVVSTANNSYFTDAVIDDVAEKLVELYGIEDDAPDADGNVRTAFEKAVTMVYSKGLKIYTTLNPNYQEIAEEVFENTDYTRYTDSQGEPLQAAMTLIDPFTGNVLAMVGGTGAKEYDRGWNWATSVRQCGSAIKPVSTYAPALDDGTITAASTVDDYPIYLEGYGVYPKNSNGVYSGLMSVQQALKESSNCAAVKINQLYGTAASYNFMTEKLGFTTLTSTDSEQVGNMALGGLQYGVTTEEMAAAFAAFVNDGIYTQPRTFVKVEDSNGEVLLENESKSNVAMKETTAYLMRQMLSAVVSSGTGTEADFSGMPTAGKTGTTDDNRDRYFVGFTPYYCAAVWCGYKSNEVMDIWGNPSANLWRQVMSKIHESLEYKEFNSCSGLVEVTVCSDSGLLATDACTHDLRGNRTRKVLVAADTAPTQTCTMHKMVSYCTEGKHVATENCPASSVKEVALLDYNRALVTRDGAAVKEDLSNAVQARDHQYLLLANSVGETCPVHQQSIGKPNEGQDPDEENPDGENPGGQGSGGDGEDPDGDGSGGSTDWGGLEDFWNRLVG